jgi:hypothetical protein
MRPREFELKLGPTTMRQPVGEAWLSGGVNFLAQVIVHALAGNEAVEVALQTSPDGSSWEEVASLRQLGPGHTNLPASRVGGRWVRVVASASRGRPVLGRVRVYEEAPKENHREGKEGDHGR